MGYRTDHSRARGLGAAKHGAGHWIAERVSAIALIPLCVWIVFAAIRLARGDYSTAVNFIANPFNAVLLALLILTGFWHMHAGMRVIVEDYVHEEGSKLFWITILNFLALIGTVTALFAILKIAFAAPGGMV